MEFVQDSIATLHDFGSAAPTVDPDRMAIVVPVMGRDVGQGGVRHTLEVLARLDPAEILVPFRGNVSTKRRVDAWLDELPVSATVIRCNGPDMRALLRGAGLPTSGGKGLDVWLSLGVAAADHQLVVVHDADSKAYVETHVPRLAWPIERDFAFAKGYYARIEDDRLYGRLTRLLWMPLLETIRRTHHDALLQYLGGFRYPLAGEFALSANVADALRLPPGWGLEVGMLGEMFEHAGPRGTAQVDLGWHEHEHRPVGGADGLVTMSEHVVAALFELLDRRGIPLDREALGARYEATAREFVRRYAVDASFNGLEFDADLEREQVARYREVLGSTARLDRLPSFRETSLTPGSVRSAGKERCHPRQTGSVK